MKKILIGLFVDEHFYQFSDVLSEDISVLGYGPIAQTFIKMISGFSGNIKVITRTPRTNLKIFSFIVSMTIKNALKNQNLSLTFFHTTIGQKIMSIRILFKTLMLMHII